MKTIDDYRERIDNNIPVYAICYVDSTNYDFFIKEVHLTSVEYKYYGMKNMVPEVLTLEIKHPYGHKGIFFTELEAVKYLQKYKQNNGLPEFANQQLELYRHKYPEEFL